MSECSPQANLETLRATFTAKCTECSCSCTGGDPDHLPTNQDDWCGDSGNQVADIRDAANGLLSNCGMVANPALPDPGAPGDCFMSDDYMLSLIAYIAGFECALSGNCNLDLESLLDATTIDTNDWFYKWWESEQMFPPGHYVIRHVSGYWRVMTRTKNLTDRPTNQLNFACGSFFHAGSGTMPRVVTKDCDDVETDQGTILSLGTGIINPNTLTYQNTTSAANNAAYAGLSREFDLYKPSKIGVKMRNFTTTSLGDTDNDVNPSNALNFDTDDALTQEEPRADPILVLTPCAAECAPVAVTDAQYQEGASLGEFSWIYHSNCACRYKIYATKITGTGSGDVCDDDYNCDADPNKTGWECCEDNQATDLIVTVDHPNTAAESAAMLETVTLLATGVYCGRIDVEYEDGASSVTTVTGQQWCFAAECEIDGQVEGDLLQPEQGEVETHTLTSRSQLFQYRVKYATRYELWVSVSLRTTADVAYDNTGAWSGTLGFSTSVTFSPEGNLVPWWLVVFGKCGDFVVVNGSFIAKQTGVSIPSCTPSTETLTSWTVINGGPTKTLSPWEFSGGNFDRWEIRETSYGVVYAGGGITATGTLTGLPATWTPPSITYTGFMSLVRICDP